MANDVSQVVNDWFTANPNASTQDVANAVQTYGGLTPELASAIAGHYGTDTGNVTSAYNQLTAPTGNVATNVEAPVGGNAVSDSSMTGGALSVGANAPWQGGINKQDVSSAPSPYSSPLAPSTATDTFQPFNTTYNAIQYGNTTIKPVDVIDQETGSTSQKLSLFDSKGNALPPDNIVPVGNGIFDLQMGSAGGTIHTYVKQDPNTGNIQPIQDYKQQVQYTGGQKGGFVNETANALSQVPFLNQAVAIAAPEVYPYLQGLNAVNAVNQGNVPGALLSGFNAYTGLTGNNPYLKDQVNTSGLTTGQIQNVNTGLSAVNALATKNPVALANAVMSATDTKLPSEVGAGAKLIAAGISASKGDVAGFMNSMMGFAKSQDPKVSSSANKVISDVSNGVDPKVAINEFTSGVGLPQDVTNAIVALGTNVSGSGSIDPFMAEVNRISSGLTKGDNVLQPGYGNTISTTAGLGTDQNPLGSPFTKSTTYDTAYQKLIDNGMSPEDADRIAQQTVNASGGSQVEVVKPTGFGIKFDESENSPTSYQYIVKDANGKQWSVFSTTPLSSGDSISARFLNNAEPYVTDTPSTSPLTRGVGGGGGNAPVVGGGETTSNGELIPLTVGQGSPLNGSATQVANVNIGDNTVGGNTNAVVNPNSPLGGNQTNLNAVNNVTNDIPSITITGSPLTDENFVPNLTKIVPSENVIDNNSNFVPNLTKIIPDTNVVTTEDTFKPNLTKIIPDQNTVTLPSTATIPTTTKVTTPTTTSLGGGSSKENFLPMVATMLAGAPMYNEKHRLAQLHQLYDSLDPHLAKVLQQAGIIPPEPPREENTPTEEDKILATGKQSEPERAQSFLGLAEGGSALEQANAEFKKQFEKPSFMSSTPTMLGAAPVVQQESRLSPLRHLKQGIRRDAPSASLLKDGGLPHKYKEASPEGHDPEFITGLTGYYADGKGTGQSDDIPAMLHEGDYVMDADTVASFGDGSSKAGAQVMDKFHHTVPHKMAVGGNPVPAKIADGEYVFPASFVTALGGGDNKLGSKLLDSMREELRAHKRSAPDTKIPPKAKSPLEYLKMAKG